MHVNPEKIRIGIRIGVGIVAYGGIPILVPVGSGWRSKKSLERQAFEWARGPAPSPAAIPFPAYPQWVMRGDSRGCGATYADYDQ
jgi:hypothetical protein